MLHANIKVLSYFVYYKLQNSNPFGFKQEEFQRFSYIHLYFYIKHDPQGGVNNKLKDII